MIKNDDLRVTEQRHELRRAVARARIARGPRGFGRRGMIRRERMSLAARMHDDKAVDDERRSSDAPLRTRSPGVFDDVALPNEPPGPEFETAQMAGRTKRKQAIVHNGGRRAGTNAT